MPLGPSFMPTKEVKIADGERVCVIGSGCAGLGAAWALKKSGVNVTLLEADERLGGHANTVIADGVPIDTGFMVYNEVNYPYLISLFKELGIEGDNTDMGFSVSIDNGRFEWCAATFAGLMATPSNIINPRFYIMMYDIFRFNAKANAVLKLTSDHPSRSQTLGQFLKSNNFSDAFITQYLIPMTAAIWSASAKSILDFPAITLFTFLKNHLLLNIVERIQWQTPMNRSREYVDKIYQELTPSRVQLGKKIKSVTRKKEPIDVNVNGDNNMNQDKRTSKVQIIVEDESGEKQTFDRVIFATHPDQALSILGSNATPQERFLLSRFTYSTNDTYVHSDEELMPKSRAAWTSWNYMCTSDSSRDKEGEAAPVYVTYWINKLQNLKHHRNIFVSLNPSTPPRPHLTHHRINYAHPQYNHDAVDAQDKVQLLNRSTSMNTHFCGAWLGYGFHEDGAKSGLKLASFLTRKPLPWESTSSSLTFVGNGSIATKATQQQGLIWSLVDILTPSLVKRACGHLSSTIRGWIASLCKKQIYSFLSTSITRGSLTFKTEDGEVKTFGTSNVLTQGVNSNASRSLSRYLPVSINLTSSWFWVRLALEADLGLARSYIAGEFKVEEQAPPLNSDSDSVPGDALTNLFLVLIENMPNGKSIKKGGLDVAKMTSAWIGSALNALWYRLTMDNSISNSRSNIHAHYDLSNELFQTFLDKEHMMYSSAIFETQQTVTSNGTKETQNFTDALSLSGHNSVPSSPSIKFLGSLESAQERKIDALLARLQPLGPEHTLLDIGFGWGGICIRAAELYGCKVHGITLSVEQMKLAQERVRNKGLDHLITFEIVDYRVFAKQGRVFDRIVSCEMIEAVGHDHLPSFFAAVNSLLDMEGIFVMQAITMPDSRYELYKSTADFIKTIIFPGGCCPSLSSLLHAMSTHSTLHLESAININVHYAETLRVWRKRFHQSLDRVRELGFDEAFIRLWTMYLCYCEAGFKSQVLNLQILTFSRTGNPNMIAHR